MLQEAAVDLAARETELRERSAALVEAAGPDDSTQGEARDVLCEGCAHVCVQTCDGCTSRSQIFNKFPN